MAAARIHADIKNGSRMFNVRPEMLIKIDNIKLQESEYRGNYRDWWKIIELQREDHQKIRKDYFRESLSGQLSGD